MATARARAYIVSCLSAAPACVCGRGLQPGAALDFVCLAVVILPPRSTVPAVAGCRLVGCSVVRLPLRSRAAAGVSQHVCVCLGPVQASHAPSPPAAAAAACCCRGRLAGAITGAGSGSHSGVELWRSSTGKGSSGVRGGGRRGWCEEWARRG